MTFDATNWKKIHLENTQESIFLPSYVFVIPESDQ